MDTNENTNGIWLEVSEVQYQTSAPTDSASGTCRVLLKANKDQPKAKWWPVVPKAIRDTPFDDYKAIHYEMDKKRTVLARLSWRPDKTSLCCDAFCFQSSELGSR
jgi:hypothetical protein